MVMVVGIGDGVARITLLHLIGDADDGMNWQDDEGKQQQGYWNAITTEHRQQCALWKRNGQANSLSQDNFPAPLPPNPQIFPQRTAI